MFTPLQEPAMESAGGLTVAVLVGVFVGRGVAVAVCVGVAVGRRKQEPFTVRVTDDRKEVRYVTVMTAFPAPGISIKVPGAISTEPVAEGSERVYVPSLTLPEIFEIRKRAVWSELQNTFRSN